MTDPTMFKLWTVVVILFQVSSLIEGKSLEIASYARVARNGAPATVLAETTSTKPATLSLPVAEQPEMYNFEIFPFNFRAHSSWS